MLQARQAQGCLSENSSGRKGGEICPRETASRAFPTSLWPHPCSLTSSRLCSVCSEWALLPVALLKERLCWSEGQQPPDTGLGSVIPDKSKLPAPRPGLPGLPLRTSGALKQPGLRTHVTKQSHNHPLLHPSLWVEGPGQCSQLLRSRGQSSSPLFSGITEIRTLQPGSAILSLLIS